MKRVRSLVAAVLSLALVAVSPGSGAYTAAAQTLGAAKASAVPGAGAGPAGLNRVNAGAGARGLAPTTLGLSSVLSAPSALAPAMLPAAPLIAPASARVVAAAPVAGLAPTVRVDRASALGVRTSAPSDEDRPLESRVHEQSQKFDGEGRAIGGAAPVFGAFSAPRAADLTPSAGRVRTGTSSPVGSGVGTRARLRPISLGAGVGRVLVLGAGMSLTSMAVGGIATVAMILISLVLHEIGHARMAIFLGDRTPKFSTYETVDWSRLREVYFDKQTFRLFVPEKTVSADRGSFNPLTWGSHIDPVKTVLVPALSYWMMGWILGGARPVPVNPYMSAWKLRLVAGAGPLVNLALAAAGAFAATGAVAAGLAPGLVAMLISFVSLNMLLAVLNLLPLPGFDGSFIFLPAHVRASMQAWMARFGPMGSMFLLILLMTFFGGGINALVSIGKHFLLSLAGATTGVHLASAFLPAIAAAGLVLGQINAAPPSAAGAPPSPTAEPAPVDLVVMFGEERNVFSDVHIANVDVSLAGSAQRHAELRRSMRAQLAAAGLDVETQDAYQVTPRATYALINTATIRVGATKAAELEKLLAARGFAVFPNAKRDIIRPIVVRPEDLDPNARRPVTMDENLKIIRADAVHAVGKKMWGDPEMGFWKRQLARFFKLTPVQPRWAVIDSGVATEHPLLKRVLKVENNTSGENVDDIGHGSWVHSTFLHVAPWARNTIHYKTFLDGSATVDDILRSLAQSVSDGAIGMSNSWGDEEGDPNSPDSVMIKKLAALGVISANAAGNSGPRKNTMGAPGINDYPAPNGAPRVLSIPAADRDMKIADFSSRPLSPKTAKLPGYPLKPTGPAAVGVNVEGAWREALGDADRVDPKNGPVKAISGTSMSTPAVAGAIMMLAMMFGVSERGEKLDMIVAGVMATLRKTNQGRDAEGEGFLDLTAAYEHLYKQFHPEGIPPTAVLRYRAAKKNLASRASADAQLPDDMRAVGDLLATDGAAAELAALEAQYPGIADARVDAAPPAVAEYRALSSRLYTLQSVAAAGGRLDGPLPGDEFPRLRAEISQIETRLSQLRAEQPAIAYQAAGPVKRLLLTLFGMTPRGSGDRI
ncbi:MAG: S8 family serine peptidase [Elusimicrobia bacterium]|nr:S8 family serine peptidase [Elusimicrobiota bacterium]